MLKEGLTLDFRLAQMLQGAAELGGIVALTEVGQLRPYLSKAEAYRKYGRGVVDNWIAEGIITEKQDTPNCKVRLCRKQLASVAASQNLVQYIASTKNGH
ncbi:hypothetical protein [Sphingobacterium sp. UGAL515B_05]|uniref:hypothetical protein n=1 Tax=Sphingobacterium sp. UGAL515B_05 TaxID=2986767 RepID=UPI002954D901|nr:hypothetical protein [Sphingobacterium sp. UGAL515B_05]WON94800.1 hypothetical protein OK025_26640 [Sphingobacterium sp. UGAL515B_05]